MSGDTKKLSVLMGDVIGSEKMDRSRLHEVFNDAISKVNVENRTELVSPLTITLGDEFQGLLPSSALAFHMANTLRLRLLFEDVPCRFVIGQADIQTPINKELAWNMLGDGLANAREVLNRKQDANAYRFSLLGASDLKDVSARQSLLDVFGSVLSETERGWSEKQLETISLWDQFSGDADRIAEARGVSRRSVYYTLESAGWDNYRSRREALRTYLAECVRP
ncbi:SatD family protein [Roseibium sp. SCPC15]|uniref:SatD family protein n=1 Tax=Roseibium sp. SCP15 TaxID=3141376 RepID=UPI0033390B37